jgi:hypothetical protein
MQREHLEDMCISLKYIFPLYFQCIRVFQHGITLACCEIPFWITERVDLRKDALKAKQLLYTSLGYIQHALSNRRLSTNPEQ